MIPKFLRDIGQRDKTGDKKAIERPRLWGLPGTKKKRTRGISGNEKERRLLLDLRGEIIYI